MVNGLRRIHAALLMELGNNLKSSRATNVEIVLVHLHRTRSQPEFVRREDTLPTGAECSFAKQHVC